MEPNFRLRNQSLETSITDGAPEGRPVRKATVRANFWRKPGKFVKSPEKSFEAGPAPKTQLPKKTKMDKVLKSPDQETGPAPGSRKSIRVKRRRILLEQSSMAGRAPKPSKAPKDPDEDDDDESEPPKKVRRIRERNFRQRAKKREQEEKDGGFSED